MSVGNPTPEERKQAIEEIKVRNEALAKLLEPRYAWARASMAISNDFAVNALKGIFALNGGALVFIPAGHSLLTQDKSTSFLGPMLAFIVGLLLCVFAYYASHMAQRKYTRQAWLEIDAIQAQFNHATPAVQSELVSAMQRTFRSGKIWTGFAFGIAFAAVSACIFGIIMIGDRVGLISLQNVWVVLKRYIEY